MQNFYLIQLTDAEQKKLKASKFMKLTVHRDLGNGNFAFYSSKPKSSLVPDIARILGAPNPDIFKRFGFLTEEEKAAVKETRKAESKEKAKKTRLISKLEELIPQARKMGINVDEIFATVKAAV